MMTEIERIVKKWIVGIANKKLAYSDIENLISQLSALVKPDKGMDGVNYATRKYIKDTVLPEVIEFRKNYNDYPMEFKYWNTIAEDLDAICKENK